LLYGTPAHRTDLHIKLLRHRAASTVKDIIRNMSRGGWSWCDARLFEVQNSVKDTVRLRPVA
jgi:hypothetical protein